MSRISDKRSRTGKILRLQPNDGSLGVRSRAPQPSIDYSGMRLIPWKDIWASLSLARGRGNREMIEVFYDTLFKEAVFDDRGAWSLDVLRRHYS
ncbi:MAG TPA: hypothetical protein VFU31_28250 [Candidatus Binatia bacterium]|nr:hypothetical protein [Candidatus Binatia bacterium]